MITRSCFLRRARIEYAKFDSDSRSRTGDGGSDNAWAGTKRFFLF
jgi:hypothetical protein